MKQFLNTLLRRENLRRTWHAIVVLGRIFITLFILGVAVTIVAVLLVEYPNPFVRQLPTIEELSARWIAWVNTLLANI